MELINSTQNKFHHLAQYLAAFSNSYLEKRPDDSQSALIWSISKSALQSQKVNDLYLELSYQEVYLRIYKNDTFKELDLLGLTESGIDSWIRETLEDFGLSASKYHHDLGFSIETPFDTFVSLDNEDEKIILQLIEQRNIAQKALESVKVQQNNTSSIYVWPHHFDTGMLVYEDNSQEKGFGLGYAIADDNVYQLPYYYAYPFSNKKIDYANLKPLANGQWILGNWNGAIIPVDEKYDLNVVEKFYKDFIDEMNDRLEH
ncbi:hypothetical protein [Galbibacter mesophilus]|uniref:hypothetical protein n=1 Tax=Galbibacter mesophilus TaxID=379069 RepID=UPI00191FA593|nr:hypothetical protein [Galbibacter mesophilus]MCM5661524.1 hypothetical protein [Galbibacter mesophilus]